ncbi:60S ribosomal protein L10e, putative [Babesia caballi]|uniref:60S ribosomal protein L10e, putative n=1 Tax=Babesia caballi TaxID=5871 RepID=A0AAV4M0R2_BABCB|nr:60S ribosomal protein L10e, putative [Babesia caballi]
MVSALWPFRGGGTPRHIPGQLELIDTGISSESEAEESEACEAEALPPPAPAAVPKAISTPTRARTAPEAAAAPVRVALRRYAVSKDETLQHLLEHWYPLLAAEWPLEAPRAADVMAEANALIGIQRRWLSNYECALLFRIFAAQAGSDVGVLRRIFEFALRWWFCGQYDVHLSQFPHLGNETVLSNAMAGLTSTFWARARLVLHLLDSHDDIVSLFGGVLIPSDIPGGHGHPINAGSCNALLLRMLPILRRGCLKTEPEAVCSEAVRFVEVAAASASELRFDQSFDNCETRLWPDAFDFDAGQLLDDVWRGVLRCCVSGGAQERECDCHGRIAGMLLNLLADGVARDSLGSMHKVEECGEDSAGRLIGFFGKWVLDATGGTSVVEESTLGKASRGLFDEEATTGILNRISECGALCGDLKFTFGTCLKSENRMEKDSGGAAASQGLTVRDKFLVQSLQRVYAGSRAWGSVLDKQCVDVITGAALLIEEAHLRREVVLDEGYSRPLLAVELSQTREGRTMVSRLLRNPLGYNWCPDVGHCEGTDPQERCSEDSSCYGHRFSCSKSGYNANSRGSSLCACFGNLHVALCEAAEAPTADVLFSPELVTVDGPSIMGRNVEFKLCRHVAFHMLDGLCDALQRAETCCGNMPVIVGDKGAAIVADSIRPVASTTYAIVALCSLMGTTVAINKNDGRLGVVRLGVHVPGEEYVMYDGKSQAVPDDEVLGLLVRLMYAEIATDAAMAMEYHCRYLAFYRTLLVQHLRKALLRPTRRAFTISVGGDEEVDFDGFLRRLMRLLFFRVHSVLLDGSKLERFMRTRVDYFQGDESTDDGEQFLEEINRGYLELSDEEENGRTNSDSEREFDVAVDHRIFGFLEYSRRQRINYDIWRRRVKREPGECVKESGEDGFLGSAEVARLERGTMGRGIEDAELLFFEAVFALCGQLRFCVDDEQLFQHNKVDRVLYQLFLHICHLDKDVSSQRNYEANLVCNVERVYETNEFGEPHSSGGQLQSDGLGGRAGAPEWQPLVGQSDDCERSSEYVSPDVLFLSRRKFTKRSYYLISRMAIEALVRWLSPESASCAVCRWASSVPIDTTTRVKAHKPATARAIVTMLSLSLLCHTALPSAEELPLRKVDSLVSAANVCFVNLKVSFDAVAFVEDAVDVDVDQIGAATAGALSAADGGSVCDEADGLVKVEPGHELEAFGGMGDSKVRLKRERMSISDSLCSRKATSGESREASGSQVGRGDFQWGRTHSYVPGELQRWKERKMRELRARQQRMARLRNELRKNLLTEAMHLLQTSVLFVHVLGHLVLQTADRVLDPASGFVVEDGRGRSSKKVGGSSVSNDRELLGVSEEVGCASGSSTRFLALGKACSGGGDVGMNSKCSEQSRTAVDEGVGRGVMGPDVAVDCGAPSNSKDVGGCKHGGNCRCGSAGNGNPKEGGELDDQKPLGGDKTPSVAREHGGAYLGGDASIKGFNCHGRYDELHISGDAKVRAKFDAVMQFVGLSCNTLESLFTACSAVSRCCVGGDLDVAVWDNDRMMATAEEELGLLLHEISFLRDEISAHVKPLLELHQGLAAAAETAVPDGPASWRRSQSAQSAEQSDEDEEYVEGGRGVGVRGSDEEEEEDDLASFVDFETDRHLGMDLPDGPLLGAHVHGLERRRDGAGDAGTGVDADDLAGAELLRVSQDAEPPVAPIRAVERVHGRVFGGVEQVPDAVPVVGPAEAAEEPAHTEGRGRQQVDDGAVVHANTLHDGYGNPPVSADEGGAVAVHGEGHLETVEAGGELGVLRFGSHLGGFRGQQRRGGDRSGLEAQRACDKGAGHANARDGQRRHVVLQLHDGVEVLLGQQHQVAHERGHVLEIHDPRQRAQVHLHVVDGGEVVPEPKRPPAEAANHGGADDVVEAVGPEDALAAVQKPASRRVVVAAPVEVLQDVVFHRGGGGSRGRHVNEPRGYCRRHTPVRHSARSAALCRPARAAAAGGGHIIYRTAKMPRSKRNKEVRLTAVKKHAKERKLTLVDNIRTAIEESDGAERCFVYLLALSNQRNSPLKNLRIILKPGRVFYGKNKVMQLALGAKPETELLGNLHKIAERIVGERALLVSSEPPNVVREKLEGYKVVDFAKAGHVATETILLKPEEDALGVFPGNMEPQFRQLGLPTTLNMGRIELLGEYQVCEQGRPLTPNQARVLKLLGIRMSLFEVTLEAYWSDGAFHDVS